MMILSKLYLENFKRYTTKIIEFGEGLIGIIGKNGSGKSTIFEAIFFALYGEVKMRGNKELIRNANAGIKEAVVVELEFEFEAKEYKVVRKFLGKTMSANAKLYKNGELITTGAKEVTNSIINLTKMGKDAFIHTLFASQKELTSLSTLKNEDRKKMIRRLLGLEKIDFVEKELVEKSRELKREINAFAEVLLSDEEIKTKQEQIKANEFEKDKLQKELVSKSQELQHIKSRESLIKKELIELTKTKEHKQKIFSELELVKNSKSSEVMNQVKLTAELHELEHKQKSIDKLKNIKAKYIELQKQLDKQNMLKEFHLKKEGLQKEQISLRDQYIKSKADIQTLEKACQNYEQYKLKMKNLEKKLFVSENDLEEKNISENKLYLEIATEQRIIDETNVKIKNLKELGSEGECPTCTRPLLEEYDNVINALKSVVDGSGKKKIDMLKTQLLDIQTQKKKLQEEKKFLDKEYKELFGKLTIIDSKLKDLKKEQEHFKYVEQKGLKNKKHLKELEQYSYDEKQHLEVKKSLEVIEPKYKELLNLEVELKRMPFVKADLKEVIKKIQELDSMCKDKEKEFKSIVYDDKKHNDLLQEHESILKTIDSKTTIVNELKIQIAKIDEKTKSIQNLLQNNDTKLKKLQAKKDDLIDYDKIKTSLAKFKTKLNAKIAPRISFIASQMYAQITKGRYQHIEVNNDFDFFIFDDGKKYPIERFSGGEIDLANLVLRIAISKTLTELNGASSIGFLAFDEVFGSQDETRRMEILEAFHTIKEHYRQIFLISHEMEIKEMFEQIIEL